MASSDSGEIEELKNSVDDVTSDGEKLQNVNQQSALPPETNMKINEIISRIKVLEDGLVVTQSDLDRLAISGKQMKEELVKWCKEQHETTQQNLEKEIHKHHNEMRKTKDDLAKQIASAEVKFTASVDTLSANQHREAMASGEMTEKIENIEQNYTEKFNLLEKEIETIKKKIKQNEEDLDVVKQEFQTFQIRAIATEEKLSIIQNKTKRNLNALIIGFVLIFSLVILIIAWVYAIYQQTSKFSNNIP